MGQQACLKMTIFRDNCLTEKENNSCLVEDKVCKDEPTCEEMSMKTVSMLYQAELGFFTILLSVSDWLESKPAKTR